MLQQKQKLLDKHYKSHHIQNWKGDEFEHEWEELGIEPGIGREMANNVNASGRRKKPARALTRMPSHAVSTGRVITYNDRSRLTPVEATAMRKNVIPYEIDKDLLSDRTLDDDPWRVAFYGEGR